MVKFGPNEIKKNNKRIKRLSELRNSVEKKLSKEINLLNTLTSKLELLRETKEKEGEISLKNGEILELLNDTNDSMLALQYEDKIKKKIRNIIKIPNHQGEKNVFPIKQKNNYD